MNEQSNVSHLSAYEQRKTLHRRVTAGASPRPPFSPSADHSSFDAQPTRKKFVAKGHDSQLQDAQYNKFPVLVTTMDGGIIEGTVTRRDKYTITVTLGDRAAHLAGKDLMIFKHSIESVLIDRSTPAGDKVQ